MVLGPLEIVAQRTIEADCLAQCSSFYTSQHSSLLLRNTSLTDCNESSKGGNRSDKDEAVLDNNLLSLSSLLQRIERCAYLTRRTQPDWEKVSFLTAVKKNGTTYIAWSHVYGRCKERGVGVSA